MEGMSLSRWATGLAQDQLELLPRRLSHVQGVARKARALRAISGQDADLLEAAAVLHDVGYASIGYFNGVLLAALTPKTELDHGSIGFGVTVSHRGQAEGIIFLNIFFVANTNQRHLQ